MVGEGGGSIGIIYREIISWIRPRLIPKFLEISIYCSEPALYLVRRRLNRCRSKTTLRVSHSGGYCRVYPEQHDQGILGSFLESRVSRLTPNTSVPRFLLFQLNTNNADLWKE